MLFFNYQISKISIDMPELKDFINKKILKSAAIVLLGQTLELDHFDLESGLLNFKVEENDSGKINIVTVLF
jgi:hypothetical protein